MNRADTIALVLGGGNALGAYQAGAYAALHRGGVRLDRIVGASAGAINGAIIAGNASEDRLDRLEAFWRPASAASVRTTDDNTTGDTARRTIATSWALTTGRSGVFRPRSAPIWQALVGDPFPSLYDAAELEATLEQLVDFARLNGGDTRYCATALDLESGEDVVFDSAAGHVTARHVRASSALPPVFPPVEIEGRLFVDAGLSANLPLDPLLSDLPAGTTLCLAVDLLPLAAPRPLKLGEMIERTQDLIFAAQARHSMAGWRSIFAARPRRADDPTVTVVHLQYADQAREIAGKAFDFSPESVRDRWSAGARDMTQVLDRLAAGTIALGEPGLTIETVRVTG